MARTRTLLHASFVLVTLLFAATWAGGQTAGEPEEFTAVAVVNNNLGSGAGTVIMQVTRWSTDAERARLVNVLMQDGPMALLEQLQDTPSTGRIRTPDSLGYDLRFAQQTPGEDGGRRIVLGTDRPIGFWEATNRPRTIDYPFTVIQMNIGRDGRGTGTLSYFTKILAHDNMIELENFATAPVLLTDIKARPLD